MRKTREFNTEDVILTDFGLDLVELNEPVRCNHVVLVLCRKGRLSLELNYTVYNMKQNMYLIISPLDIVTLKSGSEDFLCTALILPPSIFTSLFTNVDVSKIEYMKNSRIVELEGDYLLFVQQVLSVIDTAKRLLPQDKFNKVAEKQVISIFHVSKHFYSVHTNYKNENKEFFSRKKELFRKFIQELVSSHAISREVLFYANELGVSCGYLNEICNEVSNHSAKEIIDSAVAAKLKYELSYTSKSIQELADEYNFPSQSYFSRYYKRLTGMTPSDYRKKRFGEH